MVKGPTCQQSNKIDGSGKVRFLFALLVTVNFNSCTTQHAHNSAHAYTRTHINEHEKMNDRYIYRFCINSMYDSRKLESLEINFNEINQHAVNNLT